MVYTCAFGNVQGGVKWSLQIRCLFNLLTSELINMEETHSAENRTEFVERFGTESKDVVLRYLEDERVKMSHSNHEASSTLTTMDETAASCLMLLSKVGEWTPDRAFDCKTCGRKFSSFQALGGHRASHKKPKLDQDQSTPSVTPAKPRSHKCSICGAQFALGQALGGHMRRHRDSASVKSACSGGERDETATFFIKSSIEKVCLGLELDLNLTPRENDLQKGLLVESDLKLQLGKRDYEMELGSLQEYDLRMQIGKRRRFEDRVVGLVV